MITRNTLLLSVAGLFICGGLTLQAQDFERYAPKPVEAPPPPSAEDSKELTPSDTALDETLLVEALKAVVIRDRAGDVLGAGVQADGVVASENPLTQTDEFRALFDPYLGQPVSLASLDRMSREIIRHFRRNNLPVVDVGVPQQDITNGVVQVVVVEGRFGATRVEGNRYFSDNVFLDQVRLERGGRIDSRNLIDDISWMNMNPFRSVQPVFAPGAGGGETDIVLRVRDRFPVRVYTGYEDSGNELTGEDRWLFGVNWGNAFGHDHQLNYQYTTSDDFSSVQAHTLSYFAPLSWRHTFQAYAGYTGTEAKVDPFDLEGSSVQTGIRYTVPLSPISTYEHEVFTGFDWTRSDNSLIFGVAQVSDTTTDVGQFVFGYRGGLPDRLGSTSGDLRVFASPGGLFNNQDPDDYDAVRPGADDSYTYAVLQVERLTRLPGDFTLANNFSSQISTENLLPSEQMSFGGYNSIRGYDERELNNTDEGWILRTELRAPAFRPLAFLGLQTNDELQVLGFFDYGMAGASTGDVVRADGSTADSVRMSSAGPGLRYRLNTFLSVRVDYGFQFSDNANSSTNGRWHLGVIASY